MAGNLLAAYAFVDKLLSEGTDLFALGNSRCWLDLNAFVLGSSDSAGARDSRYTQATEERFYDETAGGIRDVMGWYDGHRGEDAWHRAAGIYIRIVAEQQLFMEGNHRCGILLASYILGREGFPPVVVGREYAAAFFRLSALIKETPKHSFAMLFRLKAYRRQLIAIFQHEARQTYLREGV